MIRGDVVRTRTAFTLIELLAVTALLGLLAVLGVGSLRRSQGDPLLAAAAQVQAWDAAERRQSRLHGPRTWRLDTAGAEAVLAVTPAAAVTRPQRLRLPPGIRCRWSDADLQRLATCQYVKGLGPDLLLELGDGVRRWRWRLLGASGQWLREDEP